VQSFPVEMVECPDFHDMGIRETNSLLEKLTGRVTALEKRPARAPRKEKWDTDRWIALGILVVTFAGVPLMFFGWLEPHLHADLKNDIALEVGSQLKDPLKQIGEIAGDVKEIKGKLEVLDPLIRELTIKRIGEAGSLNSKELIARLAELKHLAVFARTQNVAIKPEVVKKVGQKLVDEGGAAAWDAALTFLDYKSFLNSSTGIPVKSENLVSTTTHYYIQTLANTPQPHFQVAGVVPKSDAARFNHIGVDFNKDSDTGNAFIVGDGGSVVLDDLELKNVVLHNVHIYYQGARVNLTNVYFINCTFTIIQQSNGTGLALAVLDPAPSTNFKAS
jgi:hypothetical protein